jgi:predicted O-methyltransferase YrrM
MSVTAFTDGLRRTARALLADGAFAWQTRLLPRRVAILQLRARVRARRSSDVFSLVSATRPVDLARLLELAAGSGHVVELGTGTAWTTVALVAADAQRRVTSFDPVSRPEREPYLALLHPDARARIELVQAPGGAGPRSPQPVDMLYVDSSHQCADVIAELRAWAPVLRPGAIVVLDDYGHVDYPGVAQAVTEMGLAGAPQGTQFVHVHNPSASLR